jgi:hypothetical protein
MLECGTDVGGGSGMTPGEARNQMREHLARWQANFDKLRAERTTATEETRRAYVARLRALQAKIADEVRAWNAGIDAYDADPARTTQREFDDQAGVREIEKQIKEEIALSLKVGDDVG